MERTYGANKVSHRGNSLFHVGY